MRRARVLAAWLALWTASARREGAPVCSHIPGHQTEYDGDPLFALDVPAEYGAGETVTVTLRPGSVSSMLGLKAGRVVQLRARDGAEAVEWARAIRRPLTLGGFVAADRADVLCNASPDAAPPTGPISFL